MTRLALPIALAAVLAAGAAMAGPAEPPAKPDRDVTTFGPPAPLSSAQRAAIAAKRAALVQGQPVPEGSPQKAAPVQTVRTPEPGTARAPRAATAPGRLAPASQQGLPLARGMAGGATHDAQAIEALRTMLGVERARAAGLAKGDDRAATGKERRP